MPSYFTTDNFATLNLRSAVGVRVVLHLGASVREHLSSERASFEELVRGWIPYVPQPPPEGEG